MTEKNFFKIDYGLFQNRGVASEGYVLHVRVTAAELFAKTTHNFPTHRAPYTSAQTAYFAAYSTKRSSEKVLRKWRLEMPWEEVKQVQDECGGVMDILQYRRVSTETALHNLTLDLYGTPPTETWQYNKHN